MRRVLLIVDDSGGAPRLLMGKRGLNQAFMPGKYVFPGGRVDRSDRGAASADDLKPLDAGRLLIDMRGIPSPARARAIALAAIRETFEEAGLVIGAPAPAPRAAGAEAPAEGWPAFLETGFLPRPSALTFFARAVTPPGRPRRFDTRFFYANASAIGHRIEIANGELSSLDWFGIEEIRRLDLPAITRVVVEDLLDRLEAGDLEAPEVPVPFYSHRNGTFRRQLLQPSNTFALFGTSAEMPD